MKSASFALLLVLSSLIACGYAEMNMTDVSKTIA